MKNLILQIQLTLLILGSIFSFGGTNQIDAYSAGHNIILQRIKGISLVIPILIYLLILVLKPGQIRHLKSIIKHNMILIAYILWALLSCFWSVNGLYSLNKITIFSLFIASAFCLIAQYLYFFPKNTIIKLYLHLYRVLSFTAIFLCAIWIYCGMQSGRYSRMIFGPHTHANQVASYLGIVFLIILFLYNSKTTISPIFKKKNLKFIFYSFFLLMIFIAFSRAVFFALICSILISYLFMTIKQHEQEKAFKKVLIIISICIFCILLIWAQNETLHFLERKAGQGLLNTRTVIWEQTLHGLSKKSLAIGWGYGFLSKYGVIHLKWVSINGAHNIFLQALAGTGIVGLSLLITLLISIFNVFRKTYQIFHKGTPAFQMGILSFFILNGSSDNLFGIGISGSFLILLFFYNIEVITIDKNR